MNRTALTEALRAYQTAFEEEEHFVARFLGLLAHPRCFHRDHLPGHVTGSAWILSNDRKKVLLVHHAKLNKWLQPGGHADGEENVWAVAQKEAQEETGLLVQPVSTGLFDIDIHEIPARGSFPSHDHYDIRFLFEADETTPLQINHESTELKWVLLTDLEKYNSSTSVLRMRDKSARSNQ